MDPGTPPKKHPVLRRVLMVLVATATLSVLLVMMRQGSLEKETKDSELAALNTTTDSPVEFTVCTYNVQGRPLFDDTKHKFPLISPLLNEFDFCAVQECFKDHRLLWKQCKYPVKLYHNILNSPIKLVGSGLTLLAKFPLKDVQTMNYGDAGEFQNWPASKGILMARFNVHGMTLDVYNTHVAAGKTKRGLRARITQGAELVDFVKKNSPPENSVIFLGDFNMRPSFNAEEKTKEKDNPKVYVFDEIMEKLGMREASLELKVPPARIPDHVLFRAGTGHKLEALDWKLDDPKFYDEKNAPLSDHEPVIVRFRLEKNG